MFRMRFGPVVLAPWELGALGTLGVLGSIALACSSSDSAPPNIPSSAIPDAGADATADASSSSSPLCVDGTPVDYPPGPYGTSVLDVLPPDLSFDGLDGPVRPRDSFEPCASRSRLLVLRTTAAWCGSCGWHAKHTRELVDDPRFADRLVFVDLLVADEDNLPPSLDSASRYQKRVTIPKNGLRVALDPHFTFAPASLSFSPLPSYVLVDTRTMRIRSSLTNPNPETFSNHMAVELAQLDGIKRPDWIPFPTFDGKFAQNEWDMIRGMRLEPAPPPDPTNEYADDPKAAELGKLLFSDTSLSPTNTVSCATCHDESKAFSDGLAQAKGVAIGDRNTPSVALAAFARWQFWDGRADTLWMQALGPFENDKEFASSRLFVAHRIRTKYAGSYAGVFGTKYPLPDMTSWPAEGKPGDATWQSLAASDQAAVNRVFVNVGKAIAAFERTIRVEPNALDRYADGDSKALTDEQKTALKLFFDTGCVQCHWGPRLTDDAFHVLRFPTGRQDKAADPGRADVLSGLAAREFVASSSFSDAPSAAKSLVFTDTPSMLGAFKTPALRGVAETAPYGHGGRFATLLEVTVHYGERGTKVGAAEAAGVIEPWIPSFDSIAQTRLPPILEVLTTQ